METIELWTLNYIDSGIVFAYVLGVITGIFLVTIIVLIAELKRN